MKQSIPQINTLSFTCYDRRLVSLSVRVNFTEKYRITPALEVLHSAVTHASLFQTKTPGEKSASQQYNSLQIWMWHPLWKFISRHYLWSFNTVYSAFLSLVMKLAPFRYLKAPVYVATFCDCVWFHNNNGNYEKNRRQAVTRKSQT